MTNGFEQSTIFGPVLATMVLTLTVWIYMSDVSGS